MGEKKASDFRYNTGETKVPWAAVGENYNADDVMAFIKFLMVGEGKEYDDAIAKVEEQIKALDKVSEAPAKLSLDKEVTKAEKMCDEYIKTEGSTFLTNCTAGFELAGKWTGLKAGDEVIVPAITFIATMAYPLSIGCKLVFADVDEHLNMDPADVARKITPNTKAIYPVHMGGFPVDMDPIMKLAKEHDIVVIEDAAHGFGGWYKGKALGTIGDFGSFSFHEVKNITSFGEGGILCTTHPDAVADLKRCRFLCTDFSQHIDKWLYDVTPATGKNGIKFMGNNFSTTEIQGLGLQLQLARCDEIIAKRRKAAEYLNSRFAECDAIEPQDLGNDEIKPTFHLYCLKIDPTKAGGQDVQVLKAKLAQKGVTEIAHFGPLYRYNIIKEWGYDQDAIAATCPNCEDVFYKRYTHFPLYGLSDDQLKYMADAILESIQEMKEGR